MSWINKIGAFKILSLIDSNPIHKAPAIIAVIGQTSFNETLSAGQLMQRTWIELNTQGIAVHPYYVISDILSRQRNGLIPQHLSNQAKTISDHSTQLFNLKEGETLHMLFRIGYPKKKAKRSKRLPLEKICSSFNNA